MQLVVLALSIAAAFALIVGLIIVYVRRVADVVLTGPFRAAETIVDGQLPHKWAAQINRRLALLRFLRRDVTGTELALAQLDKLSRFFAKSPFFESERVRVLLLTQLWETRERWADMTWEELGSEP
jgi:hypothetical protein